MGGLLQLRGWVVVVMALFVAACAPSPEKDAQEPEAARAETRAEKEPEPAAVVKPLLERQDYVVVREDSDVRILVYREGRLASKVGHNHVISSPDIQGTAVLTRELVGSTVDIRIPVATLVLDDPEQRKEAGREFSTTLSESDIENTRRTMLSSRVLDAGPYPLVRITATVTGGTPPDMQADLSMTLHGVEQQFPAPVKLERQGPLATATGAFSILQSDFGIEPFSMLGGSLSVKDEVKIQYRIVAKPKDSVTR